MQGKKTEITGHVAVGFEPVRQAFQANFDDFGDVGAAVAVYRNGELVVDLWGGDQDIDLEKPWQEDTLQLVFSATKATTAVGALMLVDRGELDLDAPVSQYWPEFAAAGKESIPVRWLLCHKAGLPAPARKLTPEEVFAWDPICAVLAEQAPEWDPGTTHGYHALTFGFLVGEVIRRISGRTPGKFFAEEVAAPLGLDTFIGLPEALEDRVAPLVYGERAPNLCPELPEDVRRAELAAYDPLSLSNRASGITSPRFNYNSREVHAAELPAANGITTARSLAKMYAAVIAEVDGVRLLSQAIVDAARSSQAHGPDEVLLRESNFGLGFMLQVAHNPLLSEGSFGHPGFGGSLGFADPESGIAYAYVTNTVQSHPMGDPRRIGLIDGVRASI